VNGENLSIAYSSTGNTVTAHVTTYDITGAVSDGTGLATDYTVALTNGTLTVNPKAISYTIGNDHHDYGSTADLAADLPDPFTTYDITGAVSDGTGLATDYTVALTNGTLTVNPKAISYTIGNDHHDYGSTVNLGTDLAATFNTGVNGENLAVAYSSTGNTVIA